MKGRGSSREAKMYISAESRGGGGLGWDRGITSRGRAFLSGSIIMHASHHVNPLSLTGAQAVQEDGHTCLLPARPLEPHLSHPPLTGYQSYFCRIMDSGRDYPASSIFNSPPKGTALRKINSDYDCIEEGLTALTKKAESAYADILKGIDEVREAVAERRSLTIRGAVEDNSYDINLLPEEGEFRWVWSQT